MIESGLFHRSTLFFRSLLWNPYLKAVRNSLTLTLPLVMAGSAAVLIANFPLAGYRDFMASTFGANWRTYAINITDGTFNVLALIMLLTISYSLAEYSNTRFKRHDMNPAVASLVSLACLLTLVQPYSLLPIEGDPAADGAGIPFYWLGIHGLFLSIFVAFVSSMVFLRLKRVSWLNISFYSEEADSSVSYAFAALFPGMITIFLFALIKTVMAGLGVTNIHQALFTLMSSPITRMENTFPTALFYNFARHFFWFFGIHGSNLLEPITNSIYSPAMEANIAAVASGQAPTHIFTRTFFDAFISMGGSGSTMSLIFACFLHSRRGSMFKISQLSLLPALFNINETILFGLPIVLNPVFLIPFLALPLIQCTVGYLAMYSGLVPLTIHSIDWTAPIFIGGYAATGSYAGAALQFVNFAIGIAVYYPFVKIADLVRRESFNRAFRELMPGYAESIGDSDYALTEEAKALSRSLAIDLSEAQAKKELSLEYQPQVDSLTGKVIGVEALMRWTHSHLGRIPPGLFITLAEESGLIKSLGSWALNEACRQLAAWRKDGVADVTMSVNLSVHQLDGEEILEEIAGVVKRYNLPPELLEVEVTESAAMGGGGRIVLLRRIHALGVALAIDDFGMGHSSLVYLKQFPVDTLKIDRVLSKDVSSNRYSSEIIYSICELCHTLKIHPLAEFVDDAEQLKALQGMGCSRIQGYLYSPPLPPAKCLEFIRKGARVY